MKMVLKFQKGSLKMCLQLHLVGRKWLFVVDISSSDFTLKSMNEEILFSAQTGAANICFFRIICQSERF